MAFYTTSVNEYGVEVHRPKTHRGFVTHRSIFNESDLGSVSSAQGTSLDGFYSRYAHSSTCIETDVNCMGSLSQIVPSIVPPLDLNSSVDTQSSSENGAGGTFPIHKDCKVKKISPSDAFETWLSAKKKLKSYELAKQKAMREEQKRQIEEKKQLAEEEYKNWLANKLQAKDKPAQREMQVYQEVCQTHNDDSESNRRAWEQSKLEEQRRKREQLLKAKKHQAKVEEMRKKKATIAWEEWLAEAPLKPKPVPLNRGFLTLKGTISDIFINPIPWHNINDTANCNQEN